MSLRTIRSRYFDAAQAAGMAAVRRAMLTLSARTGALCGIKDVDSRHIAASDGAARCVGLARGADIEGRLDQDLPREQVARFADAFVEADLSAMAEAERGGATHMLVILDYATELRGGLCVKRALVHRPTTAVLGVLYNEQPIDARHFFELLPRYFADFGIGCNLRLSRRLRAPDGGTLDPCEHEVAFLLSVGWSRGEIVAFMRARRMSARAPAAPGTIPGAAARVEVVLQRLATRLGAGTGNLRALREMLVARGVHRQPPASLFLCLVRSRLLHSRPVLLGAGQGPTQLGASRWPCM